MPVLGKVTGLGQIKILKGLRKTSRTLQTQFKPRVNHP